MNYIFFHFDVKSDVYVRYSFLSFFDMHLFMSNNPVLLNHTLSLPCFSDLGCLLQYRGASR